MPRLNSGGVLYLNLRLTLQKAYIVYPPEGPRPPGLEELQEVSDLALSGLSDQHGGWITVGVI